MGSSYPYGATDPSIYDQDPDYLDDEYDDDPDPCDHEEYEIDILDGRARCDRCGERWHATQEQIEAEIERIRLYQEWEEEQRRPWNRFKEWARDRIDALAFWRRWRKLRPQASIDDEIPF